MSNKIPEISVVTCHHTGEFLFGFLDSIFKSTFGFNVDFEVIVITSDEELAMKGIKNCLVVHNTGLPAEKRNIGARLAKGKYLAFFDDDVEVSPDCLWQLKQGLRQTIGMTYGKLWNMEHQNRFDEAGGFMTWTGFIWSRAGQNDIDSGQFDMEEYILAGKSASCMVKKDVFNKVGGFDESFGILGEETDLSWRIWLSGKCVLFMPLATGYHAFNTKFKPREKHYTSSRVHYNGCRNYLTMLIKNLGKEHLWIVPIHALIWTFVGFAMIITLKIRQGVNILRGLWYVLSHLKEILKKRGQIQSTRITDEHTLWKVIYSSTPRGYYKTRLLRYLTLGLHG